jgi:uncharacterized protein (DUF305 family)
MRQPSFRGVAAALFLAGVPVAVAHEIHTSDRSAARGAEASFYKENVAAMNKMMSAMEVKPTGDIDRDFVAMMTPHHQGAIDMAIIQLRYGKNEVLRRLAQEIIVEQMQEIDAMRLAIGEKPSASAPVPTQVMTAPPTAEPRPEQRPIDMNK